MFLLASGASYVTAESTDESASLTYSQFETAGIDGREWDKTFPGARTLDAVHRSILLRFPGTAEAIKAAVDKGHRIDRAEIAIDYEGYEISPPGYLCRDGLGEAKWKADPPQWHVIAWALRRPWAADKAVGPTFNAYIDGAGYWSRYGASDPEGDRFADRLGPAELSLSNQTAHLDVTPLLNDGRFGETFGARLRQFEDCGVLLKKWETYDVRYRDTNNAYEWAVPTGGHGLAFKTARLVLTLGLAKAGEEKVDLPAPIAINDRRTSLLDSSAGGKPTAVMPSEEEFARYREQIERQRAGNNRENWQTKRLSELYAVGGDDVSKWAKAVETGNSKEYGRLIRELLSTPPRYWKGWSIQDDLLIWFLYRDFLPLPVQDHMKAYWESWLMPDIPTSELFHPQSPLATDYWKKTKDWRGRTSFFRAGYNYATGTENFNHTAAMGALLGGSIIGSEFAMNDGRHGLENFPLRLWATTDGTTQEMLDHYYFSITLSGQKMFSDFGPTAYDRHIGRILVDRTLELLATAYHPNLRRFINASGRARLSGVLVEQDGVYGALHTLSKNGTLNYIGTTFETKEHGMPAWGYDVPPGRIATQGFEKPWGADWYQPSIDDKSLPFEETATETTRGAYHPPLWQRSYLARTYGLASQDLKGGTVNVVAQWIRKNEPSKSMEDIGSLTIKYAINDPDMATTSGGTMPQAGVIATFQHANRAIVFGKPLTDPTQTQTLAKGNVYALSLVVALWNFQPKPGWEIFVDGKKIETLPFYTTSGQIISIHDGVTYIGIIPLPATDLGRDAEIEIGFGGGGRSEPNGATIQPALTIRSYNLKRSPTLAEEPLDWPRIAAASYTGFIIEMGNEAEYGSFGAFMRQLSKNGVEAHWEEAARILHVRYHSGNDLLEAGFGTSFRQGDVNYWIPPGEHVKALPYRRINGQWPYPAPGIERDTPTAQQGKSGVLEKNGALLTAEKGRTVYLQTFPDSEVFIAFNPLPDPTTLSLAVPGGLKLGFDGKIGLAKITVELKENRISLEHAARTDQVQFITARNLRISGVTSPLPTILINGRRSGGQLVSGIQNGPMELVVSLFE